MNESSQEVLLANIGPAKDKHGVRESNVFIREEWPFPDKGILINCHIYIILYYDIFSSRGSPGSRGGRDPCKHTCWAVAAHMGAFKSQLVATIAAIYI